MPASFDPQQTAEFDEYAGSYAESHAASIKASGESADYFAIYKRNVLARLLGAGFDRPILDFGCGIGNLTQWLARSFPVVHGYDPSRQCVDLAKRRAPSAAFFDDLEALPEQHYGSIVLANVLHHVKPLERRSLVARVETLLAKSGRLFIFEHNPLNPLTRHAVAICKFDANAELLHSWHVKRLLRDAAGLSDVRLQYIVFFPRALRFARPLEPGLAWLPLGAQVCAWGTKR